MYLSPCLHQDALKRRALFQRGGERLQKCEQLPAIAVPKLLATPIERPLLIQALIVTQLVPANSAASMRPRRYGTTERSKAAVCVAEAQGVTGIRLATNTLASCAYTTGA